MLQLLAGRKQVLRDSLSEINRTILIRAPTNEILAGLNSARDPMRRYFQRRLGNSPMAAGLTLKVLNLLLAKHHYSERSTTLTSRPFGLSVDPCNGCNLACPGCVQSTRAKSLKLFDWNNGMLSEDRFAALLTHYGPYVMQIMFCNYGEPTLNPKTPRFIEMAKGYLAQTVLSTNLSLTRFDAEAYVRSGLDFMYLAVDGASQAVYERYRRKGDIATVYRNMENLVAAKKRLGSQTPVLRWQFLAFEHNAHEIPKAMEIAKDLGVDQFSVDIPFDVTWDDPAIQIAKDVVPSVLEFHPGTETVLAENAGSRMTAEASDLIESELSRGWEADSFAKKSVSVSAHTCGWLYKNMTMDANGRILPCCGAPKPGVDVVFGQFDDSGPMSFNSEKYRQARLSFSDRAKYEEVRDSGGPSPYCANCEWDQSRTEVGPEQVALYLRTVGKGSMDPATIEMCSNW